MNWIYQNQPLKLMAVVYLVIGSNVGDRSAYLQHACGALEGRAGHLLVTSPVYQTAAWGFTSASDFYNQVVVLESSLNPDELLGLIHSIEDAAGRRRDPGPYHDRTLDIDILFYDRLVIQQPDLRIPHPLLEQRKFVLEPLAAICPFLLHPVSGKTIWQLRRECQDKLEVRKI